MPRTQGMDHYLEAIYILKAEEQQVLASKIADYLNVSRPTVSQTLQRMNQAGYVTTGESKEVVLTPDGLARAEEIVRRHRLLERWLTDQLGLDWADAHVEAARLENSLSPLVESRLAELLGHPQTCPHGNVIPGSGYQQPVGVPLSEVEPGQTVEIIRIFEIAEEDLELLRFLNRTGLVPGAKISLEPKNRYEAGVPVSVNGESFPLQQEVAARIMVKPVEA